jgi:S1-C subfamily serine protease
MSRLLLRSWPAVAIIGGLAFASATGFAQDSNAEGGSADEGPPADEQTADRAAAGKQAETAEAETAGAETAAEDEAPSDRSGAPDTPPADDEAEGEAAPRQAAPQAAPTPPAVQPGRSMPVPAPPHGDEPAEAPSMPSAQVVRVRSAGSAATGVFAVSSRYVLTHANVVERGRNVQVETPEGNRYEATVRVMAEDQSLAVLEVGGASDIPALPIAEAPDQGGRVSVQQPWSAGSSRGTAAVDVPGQIAGRNGDVLLIASPLDAQRGAAVVGPEGLVGIVLSSGGGVIRAASAERLRPIIERAPESEEYTGKARFFLRAGWNFQVRPDDDFTAHGPTLALGGVLKDRWVAELGFTPLLFDTADDDLSFRTNADGYLFDLYLGYRIHASPPSWPAIYVTPAIGGVVEIFSLETKQLAVAGGTVSELETVIRDDEVTVMPAVRLGITLGGLELTAAAQIDTENPERTRGAIFLGFAI